MGNAKKIKKCICTGAAVLLAAAVFTHNPVYYRLYPLDRLKVKVKIIVDGEEYKLNEDDIKFEDGYNALLGIDRSQNNIGKISLNSNNSATVKFPAKDRRGYGFEIVDTPVNRPITFLFGKFEWYEINKADLTINIDTAAETLTLDSDFTELADNDIFKEHRTGTKTVKYNEPCEDESVLDNLYFTFTAM